MYAESVDNTNGDNNFLPRRDHGIRSPHDSDSIHAIASEESASDEAVDHGPAMEDWLTAKRRFREVAHQMVAVANMNPEGEDSIDYDVLRVKHADAGLALLIHTLSVIDGHDIGQFPIEDFSSIPSDARAAHSRALEINEDNLKLQLDAVGITLTYLQEERRMLVEKHAAWLSAHGSAH